MALWDRKGTSIARQTVGWLTDKHSRNTSSQVGGVLMYHGVAHDRSEPGQSASPRLSLQDFRAGLNHLRRQYDVVSVSELRERMAARVRGQKLPVALTFDDDLECHRSLAAPLLDEFGFPAIFFLTGSSLQRPHAFWWEDLDELFARGESAIAAVLREAGLASDPFAGKAGIGPVANTIKMMPPERRDMLALRMREMVGEPPREPGLSAADVGELAAAGFEIGFHTRAHYQLQTLSDGALERAFRDGLDELRAAAGRPIVTIAYPHTGADLRIAAAASAAGFELGFTGNSRPTRLSDHPLLVERIDAWPCTTDGFGFRLGRIIAHG